MDSSHPKPAEHYRNVIKAESFRATQELLCHERFVGQVYDPCRHDDGIAEAFIENGNTVFLTSSDFLSYEGGLINVVSEPRPDLGEVYVRKALSLVTAKVAFLLPVTWMISPEIKKLVEETP